MNKKAMWLAWVAMAGATAAWAGEGKCEGQKGACGDKGGMRKEILAKFDADGDGKLSDAEKAKAKEAREARHAEMIAKFDADGDGKLNDEEKAKARESWKQKHQEGHQKAPEA